MNMSRSTLVVAAVTMKMSGSTLVVATVMMKMSGYTIEVVIEGTIVVTVVLTTVMLTVAKNMSVVHPQTTIYSLVCRMEPATPYPLWVHLITSTVNVWSIQNYFYLVSSITIILILFSELIHILLVTYD